MAEYVTSIKTKQGNKRIDYNALANLPSLEANNITYDNSSTKLTATNTQAALDEMLVQMQNMSKDYVTNSELSTRGYLTSIPSEYITETKLANKNYLTSIPTEYVTETELNKKGYLTEHQSLDGYAKTSQIPSKTSQLTDDVGYTKIVNGKTAENGAVTIHASDIETLISDYTGGEDWEYNLNEAITEIMNMISALLDASYAEALEVVVSAPVVGDVTNATITIGDETYTMIEFAQSLSDALSMFNAGIASTYCTKSEMKNWVAQEIAKIPTTSYENGNEVSY